MLFYFQNFLYFFKIAVCSSTCQNGGTCSGPDTCTCPAGWSGSVCTYETPVEVSVSFSTCTATMPTDDSEIDYCLYVSSTGNAYIYKKNTTNNVYYQMHYTADGLNGKVPFGGYFNYTLQGKQFRLVGSQIYNSTTEITEWAEVKFHRIFLSNFANSLTSTSGVFFGRQAPRDTFCFKNGAYYSIAANYSNLVGTGSLVHSVNPDFSHFSHKLSGSTCGTAGCCTLFDNTLEKSIVFNGTHFLQWSGSAFSLFNPSAAKYDANVADCLFHLSDLEIRLDNGTRLRYYNSSLYQWNYTMNTMVLKSASDFDWSTALTLDPLVKGGVYYVHSTDSNGTMIRYKNEIGIFDVTIVNGVITRTRVALDCRPPMGNSYAQSYTCGETENRFNSNMGTPCDPSVQPGVCGNGYRCQRTPLELSSCSKGFCVPDFSAICPASTTTTTSTTTAAPTTMKSNFVEN